MRKRRWAFAAVFAAMLAVWGIAPVISADPPEKESKAEQTKSQPAEQTKTPEEAVKTSPAAVQTTDAPETQAQNWDENALQEAVESSCERFVDAFMKRDAKAIAALFTPEAEFVDSTGIVFHGREAIEGEYEALFEIAPKGQITLDVTSIRPIASTILIEEGVSTIHPVLSEEAKEEAREEAKEDAREDAKEVAKEDAAEKAADKTADKAEDAGDKKEATHAEKAEQEAAEDEDGAVVSVRYVATHIKQPDGSWLMASLRELTEPIVTPHSRLMALAWLKGNWREEIDGVVITTDWHWADDGHFLLGDFRIRSGGETIREGTHRIGWDGARRQFRSWIFDSEGGHSEGGWAPEDEGVWSVALEGCEPDGCRRSLLLTFARDGDDAIIVSQEHRRHGDEALPDVAHRIVRQPAPHQQARVDHD